MDIAGIKEKIKKSPKIKRFIHLMMMNQRGAHPRLWVKWFVNPFMLKKGKHSKIRSSAIMNVSPINIFSLGAKSVIESFSLIDNAVGNVTIGNHSRVGLRNTIIGPVSIGNHVIIAQNVVMSGLNHKYEDPDIPIRLQGVSVAPIVIEDECWIGANSMITSGVTIGKHSIVAGGSVVTKSIPPYSVAVGTPARIIKQYDPQKKSWVRV